MHFIVQGAAVCTGADISLDDRAWLMHMVPQMCVRDSVFTLYTRCIDVLAVPKAILDDDFSDMPMLTRHAYGCICCLSAQMLQCFIRISVAGKRVYYREWNGVVCVDWCASERRVDESGVWCAHSDAH